MFEKKREKTIIKDSYFKGALKITRPVYLDNTGQPCLYIMNPGGGYLGGDIYRTELYMERDAELMLTTQSSTRIYKTSILPAVHESEIYLKEGSILEYLPDPIIAYESSRFKQKTTIWMDRGATLFYADIFTPGWAPDGALFAYDLIQSKIKVFMEGQLVLFDHLKLIPDMDIQGIGVFDGYTHFGSMIIISEKVSPKLLDQLYDSILSFEESVKFGISMLMIPGFVIRVLAHSTKEVDRIFAICSELTRESWFNKKNMFLRKY